MILPLVAHGIGGRTDLPLSVWMFGYAAAATLVLSFAALVIFWPAARLEPAALPNTSPGATETGAGRAPMPRAAARIVGTALFLLVLGAATFGSDETTENLAPLTIFVLFWVGLAVVCGLVGDVWNGGLNPFPVLARPLLPTGDAERRYRLGHWPAAAGLLAFVWLELVAPDAAEPRVLAVTMALYTAVTLAGAAYWGRPWLRHGETFAAWFGLLGAMAPLRRDPEAGRLRLSMPMVGLARLVPLPGTVAVVLVALGSTAFDGLTRSSLWNDLVGGRTASEAVPLATVGLLWSIATVALLYLGAMKIASVLTGEGTAALADAFVHALVPIAFAYAVAHYFSLLVLEGQGAIALASDPLGRGWDLFGTADRETDYALVSPNAVAYVQVGAIVLGHLAGVVLAHDRALARFPKELATRSQYPLLAAMVALTVGGLGLLLGG